MTLCALIINPVKIDLFKPISARLLIPFTIDHGAGFFSGVKLICFQFVQVEFRLRFRLDMIAFLVGPGANHQGQTGDNHSQ